MTTLFNSFLRSSRFLGTSSFFLLTLAGSQSVFGGGRPGDDTGGNNRPRTETYVEKYAPPSAASQSYNGKRFYRLGSNWTPIGFHGTAEFCARATGAEVFVPMGSWAEFRSFADRVRSYPLNQYVQVLNTDQDGCAATRTLTRTVASPSDPREGNSGSYGGGHDSGGVGRGGDTN